MKIVKKALAAVVISIASSSAMASSVINVYDGMAAQTLFSGTQSLNGSPLEVGLNVTDINGAQLIVGLVDTTDDKGSILYQLFNDSDFAETTFLAGSEIFSDTLLDKNLDGIDDSFTKFLSFGQYVLRLTNIAPGEKFGESQVSAVPLPAAAWLFGSAALGLFGFARRRKQADVAAV